ncbi:MAG: cation:dicarboxylase symporter family transporter [Eubacterium sp.]|nr:cation:dicarboxylase symporter family transporter [Eubacterium sp.]
MKANWVEYELNSVAIEEISMRVQDYMSGLGEQTRNIQRNRLMIEEMLLRIRDAYDTPIRVRVMIGRRYGRHIFQISYEGSAFDPTETTSEDNSILETIGLTPTWGYRKKVNTVSLTISGRAKPGRLFRLILSIVLAFLIGYLGRYLPEGFRTNVDESFLMPMFNCFLGLLATFAGIMIALTITSGVLGVGDTSVLSRMGKNVIIRFVLISFMTSIAALLATYPFFHFTIGGSDQGTSFQIKDITKVFFDIFPSNPIDPFLNGNSLQIIVIGIFVGVGLLALGERTKAVRDLVMEGASLSQWITSTVCSMVPTFVFVALLHQIWSGSIYTLFSVWKPVLIMVGFTVLWTIILLLYTSIRLKCSPIRLLKKTIAVFLIGASTGSSMTAFATGMDICEKKLGVEKSYVRFSYPLGNVMYMQGTVAYLTILSLFFAETYHLEVNMMWFIIAVLSSTLLAIAVPPIPGAALMLFTILFSQLGIPMGAVVIGTALDVFFDFFDTGINVFTLVLEVADGARAMNCLDQKVLKEDVAA